MTYLVPVLSVIWYVGLDWPNPNYESSKISPVHCTMAWWGATCLRSMGALISGTFWVMYRSSDGTSMVCLTAPAILRFARWSDNDRSRREERKHFEEEIYVRNPKQRGGGLASASASLLPWVTLRGRQSGNKPCDPTPTDYWLYWPQWSRHSQLSTSESGIIYHDFTFIQAVYLCYLNKATLLRASLFLVPGLFIYKVLVLCVFCPGADYPQSCEIEAHLLFLPIERLP